MLEITIKLFQPFTFRGKSRLLHWLSPKVGERKAKIYGYNVNLDLSDYIQRSMYLQAFEPHESSLVKAYLKRGMTFVDVGANVGYYTFLASSLVGDEGKVIAFEPSPYAFNRLVDTIKINTLPQVQLIQAGLSDVSGEICLYLPKKKGNHSPSMVANEGGSPVPVPVYRLDEYLSANNIDQVDLLKIDVEGFEPNVIRGAEQYMKEGKINALLCEFNKYWLEVNYSSPSKLYNEIIQYGYKPKNVLPDFDNDLQNLLFIRQ